MQKMKHFVVSYIDDSFLMKNNKKFCKNLLFVSKILDTFIFFFFWGHPLNV